jgi:hypothetical protein
MKQVKRLRQPPIHDMNLALDRLLISIGHSVAILHEMVDHLGSQLEEPLSGEWHQLTRGIIKALQHFQRRIEAEGQVR